LVGKIAFQKRSKTNVIFEIYCKNDQETLCLVTVDNNNLNDFCKNLLNDYTYKITVTIITNKSQEKEFNVTTLKESEPAKSNMPSTYLYLPKRNISFFPNHPISNKQYILFNPAPKKQYIPKYYFPISKDFNNSESILTQKPIKMVKEIISDEVVIIVIIMCAIVMTIMLTIAMVTVAMEKNTLYHQPYILPIQNQSYFCPNSLHPQDIYLNDIISTISSNEDDHGAVINSTMV